MTQEELISKFDQHPAVQKATQFIAAGEKKIHLTNTIGSGLALIIAGVKNAVEKPVVIVANDKEEAAYLHNDLETILGKSKLLFFPSSARFPYKLEKTDNANVLQRAEVLDALTQRSTPFIVVTYAEALAEKVVTKKHLKKNTLEIKTGMELSLEFLNELLFEYQFTRVDFVTQPGEFSIRGGIVDIYSYAHDTPFRIELLGNSVDSIRDFDPAEQLSLSNFKKITIVPNVQSKMILEQRQSFLAFIPSKTLLWIKDQTFAGERIEKEFEKASLAFNDLGETIDHLPPKELYMHAEEFHDQMAEFQTLHYGLHSPTQAKVIACDQKPQPHFNRNFELLSDHFKTQADSGLTNLLVAGSAKQIERLHNVFEDLEREKRFASLLFPLHEGFTDESVKLACYTDHQLFERYHRFRLKEGFTNKQQQITLKELTDLQKGDYVVHVDHGIGKFMGLKKIDVNGKMQEAIQLKYKDNDVLYVSIHSLHRIAKYTGKEGKEPSVDKIGSNNWKNLKNKTKKRIKEIAFDLIKLYAKRKAKKGHAFAPDGYMQNELEASFIYEDTPDQESTTLDVKKDMEAPYPMDRLVCGDVGFGKTEIAMRAAFKAACDGKQVAILAPTTILTLQHYKSFKERFKEFPVTVDYVNRFKSPAKTKDTLKRLEEGKVDIIIGTHRLVGKDVKFNDLGLLVIDEEQKFGVAAKDKLKTIKVNVDTLTLTATPIPRTLQFSLMNARDLSIIKTPPPNRQPVQTELHTFNEELIRDAVHYEIQRDGQVFFVHNRVQNIQEVAGLIQRVVPGARVITAHGQMDGKELEDRMMRFIEGEYDVLVATTIIESGLDISNANTIIINQAQNFGLSDLHQMRGRVGRSNRKAFCYLLAPPMSSMSDDARKRLTAITQFSDLGSGINIAMRDLDIRGAGNLLGGEQSGFMADIGLEMYQKILKEAVDELKQNEFKALFKDEKHEHVYECQFETDLEIMLPDTYVNNITERLALYKKLADLENETDLEGFTLGLIDRFGPLPEEADRLVRSMRIKWLGRKIGFEKIVLKRDKLICYFPADQEAPYFQSAAFSKVLDFMKSNSQQAELKQRNEKLSLVFTHVETINETLEILEKLVLEEAALA